MRETWFVLEDGSVADPREVTADDDGVLRIKDGRAVAMRSPDCPRSRGVDAVAEREKAAAEAMRPEPAPEPKKRPGYKTRESGAS